MVRPLILIADDDKNCRYSMRRCLSVHDCDVMEASSGSELVDLFSKNRDALMIFTDYAMPPGINGAEALRTIRSMEASLKAERKIPVVLVSGDDNVIARSKNEGFTDKMPKPYNLRMLMAMVSMYAREHY